MARLNKTEKIRDKILAYADRLEDGKVKERILGWVVDLTKIIEEAKQKKEPKLPRITSKRFEEL